MILLLITKNKIYIYVFLVKNLYLDSNLYNLKKASKKLVKYYETYPNPK
jgi:hypothetical protein